MTTRGVCWIVYGAQADRSLVRSQDALASVCPGLPFRVMRQGSDDWANNVQQSRWAKLALLDWSPFEYTAYLDVDTQIYQSIDTGFALLADGWDLVLVPSMNQSEDNLLWHLDPDDKQVTLDTLQYDPLQLQAGVLFVARNDRTRALFDIWRTEWGRFCSQDQGALLRALQQVPVKLWLLGRPWNGGAVIGHRFGELRA